MDDLQKMEMRLVLKFGTDSIISIFIACSSIMLTILLISVHLYALVKNISSFHEKKVPAQSIKKYHSGGLKVSILL